MLLWAISCLLLAISVYVSLFNAWILLSPFMARDPSRHSVIPLVGGVVGVIGFLVCPSSVPFPIFLFPLVWDAGSAILVIGQPIYWIVQSISKSDPKG